MGKVVHDQWHVDRQLVIELVDQLAKAARAVECPEPRRSVPTNAFELGAGLTFFNKKEGDLEKFYLRLDLAMRAGYETRFQYFPVPNRAADYGIVILAPRAAITMRWSFSKDVRITEELEFIPFLLQPAAGRLLLNNLTKLNARLTENLAVNTSILVNFDSQPPLGADGLARKTTDTALTVGLEATF